MIPAEKRKYDRVKKLQARDKSDMIAGNKASEVVDPASQVLVGEDGPVEQGKPPGLDGTGNEEPPAEETPATTSDIGAAVSIGSGITTPTQAYTVFTTTITQILDGGSGNNGDGKRTILITQTVTLGLPAEVTPTNDISKSTSTADSSDTVTSGSNNSSSSGGLSNGAKIGIGVAVPIVFILLGLGIFFFFRRRKQQRLANKEGGVGEVMITGGKHHYEDGSSGGVAGSPTVYHSNVTPPSAVPGADPVPMGAAPRSRTQEEDDDLMNRPVSPVHDDDLLTGEAASSHSVTRSGTALGGSVRDRGSPSLDDDREMQWILEEERKAKERREQQGRLPTHT